MPEEPASAVGGEHQAHEVVDDEDRPHDVHRQLGAGPGRTARIGDNLPRVDGEEDEGGKGQRPLGCTLPGAQTGAATLLLRHATHRRRGSHGPPAILSPHPADRKLLRRDMPRTILGDNPDESDFIIPDNQSPEQP